MTEHKPTLCVDFDGVIHSYDKGWQNGALYGTVVDGFFPWLREAVATFRVVVYSSRSREPAMRHLMRLWLQARYDEWAESASAVPAWMPEVEYAHEKPAAFLTIDDRCVPFEGDWRDPRLRPEALRAFRSWTESPEPPARGHDQVGRALDAFTEECRRDFDERAAYVMRDMTPGERDRFEHAFRCVRDSIGTPGARAQAVAAHRSPA